MGLWLILVVMLLFLASVILVALLASRSQAKATLADAAPSNRIIEQLPEEVRADLQADVRRRRALVLGVLLPILAAVVGEAFWVSSSPDGTYPEGIYIGCLVAAVVPMVGELLATVAASRRAGATLLDLGEHPMAASQKKAGSIGLYAVLMIAVLNAGRSLSRSPVLAALWGVMGLSVLIRSLLFQSKVLLTEGGVRMFTAFHPWSALERPTWGKAGPRSRCDGPARCDGSGRAGSSSRCRRGGRTRWNRRSRAGWRRRPVPPSREAPERPASAEARRRGPAPTTALGGAWSAADRGS